MVRTPNPPAGVGKRPGCHSKIRSAKATFWLRYQIVYGALRVFPFHPLRFVRIFSDNSFYLQSKKNKANCRLKK